MAGFPSTLPGVWAYSDIAKGDYISFLYGATAHNLYQVENKYALKNAEEIGPWPSVTFKIWNKTYNFPFRLQLKPLKDFKESLIRIEFAYVGENLLLRGGYRKTHFQADQLTLFSVSNIFGVESEGKYQSYPYSSDQAFVPVFTSKERSHFLPNRSNQMKSSFNPWFVTISKNHHECNRFWTKYL